MIGRLDVGKGSLVLDPFAGAGTTLIESKLEGLHSIGFEINPLLHFVNETSLEWGLSPGLVQKELRQLEEKFKRTRTIEFDDLETHGLVVPPIHNPTRWWRKDVLVDLLVLKRAIQETTDARCRAFFLLALAGCLVPDLTNVTLGRLQLHFIDRSDDKIDVMKTFDAHVRGMIGDLAKIQENGIQGKSSCFLQNATDLSGFKYNGKVDAVITSPPYPNRYSYVWNTRPQLYFLDFFSTAKEASDLDKRTIGGTWGTATSELARGITPPLNSAIAEILKTVVDQIRERDNLMANYVVHYFNRLTVQILEMDRLLSKSASVAYVVGNSWIKDVYVETDIMLAEIFERIGLGYRVTEVHRFRRRHSGEKLYESIVYATKRK
jgi:hypothetical protein